MGDQVTDSNVSSVPDRTEEATDDYKQARGSVRPAASSPQRERSRVRRFSRWLFVYVVWEYRRGF